MPSGWRPISCTERRRSVTTRSVTVVNQLGLHARAAARFVHLATRFESRIRVGRNSKVMDGKSIMGILLLAASRGTTLTVIRTERMVFRRSTVMLPLAGVAIGLPAESK